MLSYNINKTTVTVIINSEILSMNTDDARYEPLLTLLGTDMDDKEAQVIELFEDNSIFGEVDKDDEFIRDADGKLSYNGREITGQLFNTLVALIDSGATDLDRFKMFIDNLNENPSSSSVAELYDFMAYENLPITEDGCLLAYKGVGEDYFSIHGNADTAVKQGVVNQVYQIRNFVGDVVEVARNQVDDKRAVHCSFGLHVGSYDYANSFASKILAVKVNPRDVVSVPDDCSCQKMRVCKYTCIEEIEKKLMTIHPSDDAPLSDQKDTQGVVSILTAEQRDVLTDQCKQTIMDAPHISVQTLFDTSYMPNGVTILHLMSLLRDNADINIQQVGETYAQNLLTISDELWDLDWDDTDDDDYYFDSDEDEDEF